MKKIGMAACAAAVLCIAPAAHAAPILQVVSTDGTWSNQQPLSVVVNNGGTPRTARWGVAATNLGQSGYDYTPNATPIAADVDGAAFLLGTFTHLNFPVFPPSLTSIDLDFHMNWGGGFTPNLVGKFSFTHDETTNNLVPCPYGGANGQGVNINGCADRVTITSPFLNTLITDGTNIYFFTLVGFSTDGGATTSLEFLTQEEAANTAGLYGRLTSVPIQVPEPTSMLLVGLGLVGVASRLRRRQ